MFICVAISGIPFMLALVTLLILHNPPFIHNAISSYPFISFLPPAWAAAFNTSRERIHYNFPFLSVVATYVFVAGVKYIQFKNRIKKMQEG